MQSCFSETFCAIFRSIKKAKHFGRNKYKSNTVLEENKEWILNMFNETLYVC
jgi:hypothetical protein